MAFEDIELILNNSEAKKSVFTLNDFREQMESEFVNGKPQGKTTYYPELDTCFRLKHGKLYIATGYPNHGKTEFTLQLCLIQAVKEGKKIAVYSPEAEPVEIYDTLIQSYIGKPLIKYNFKQMSIEEYKRGADFIQKHFFVIQPEFEDLNSILNAFDYCRTEFGTSVIVIDPYNEIDLPAENISERTRKIAKEIKKQTKLHNYLTFLVVHPTGEVKDKTGKRVIPTLFNLEGGRMLGNKADVVFTVDRPFKEDPGNLETNILVSKVKNQKLMGYGGNCKFTFDLGSNRYFCNQKNPLNEENYFNAEIGDVIYNPNKFPDINRFENDIF
jgi:KaiC/GvpD/RAD55 family RecA-like ATPase